MLSTKENRVRIEGVLSEIDLKYGSFNKNGSTENSINGTIKILVNQPINGVDTELEVPVSLFAAQHKNDGSLNPAYESVERIMKEYISIAASDMDRADRVRITNGQLQMNEYYGRNGNLVSFPRITATFVNKIKKEECKPEASFSVTFAVGQKGFETDSEGVETDRYKIVGMVPQWGGKVDVIPFYAINKGVIDGVSQYWQEGDTVNAAGRLNFTSRTELHKVEVDFGEPREEMRTINVSELIITGGSSTPLEGEFALDEADLKAALADRKVRLDALKEKSQNRGASGKAPTSNKFADLGF